MITFGLVFILFSFSTSTRFAAEAGEGRYRRSLLDFAKMIYAATGRNPLDYNGYGCHCGVGGRGTPVDRLDRCCQKHDSCYNTLSQRRICHTWQLYLLPYKLISPLECDERNSRCAKALCNCDRNAALCFQRRKYNDKYRNYDKWKC